MESDEHDRVDRVIQTLATATAGDLSVRLPLREDGSEQIIELEYAVNALLDELELAASERNQQREQLHEQALQLLSQQRAMVEALSTPVIVVWPRVVALPIIGEVTADRARGMCETLLGKVVALRVTHVILDLTGASGVGPQTAQSIVQMAEAVKLLGAGCVVTGIKPELAALVANLDVQFRGLPTLPSLSDALILVLRERGLRLQRRN